jgi:hypothetical protein
MPVVRDSKVYKQAASMGEVQSFIGSIDGRSGVDEDYIGNIAGTMESGGPSSFAGGPRSLKERMMLEDWMQAKSRQR